MNPKHNRLGWIFLKQSMLLHSCAAIVHVGGPSSRNQLSKDASTWKKDQTFTKSIKGLRKTVLPKEGSIPSRNPLRRIRQHSVARTRAMIMSAATWRRMGWWGHAVAYRNLNLISIPLFFVGVQSHLWTSLRLTYITRRQGRAC